MKENVLDVLMYLFENYMGDEEDLSTDQDALKLELKEAGFAKGEVEAAIHWLEELSKLRETQPNNGISRTTAIRVYSDVECKKMDTECRGFLQFLENMGVLDQNTREMVVDRVMALGTQDIDIEQLKWVILMVLFNQPGQEEAFAWIEDLVFDEERGSLH